MTGVDICMLCLCMTPLCICVNIHLYRRTGLRHSKDSFLDIIECRNITEKQQIGKPEAVKEHFA